MPVKSTVETLQNFVAFSEYMNFSHPNKQGMFASKTQNSIMFITLLYVIQGSIKKRMSKSVRFTTAAVNIGIAFFLKEQFSLMHDVFCGNIRPIWGVLCSFCRLIIFMRLDYHVLNINNSQSEV